MEECCEGAMEDGEWRGGIAREFGGVLRGGCDLGVLLVHLFFFGKRARVFAYLTDVGVQSFT